jgi:hypothetical protein
MRYHSGSRIIHSSEQKQTSRSFIAPLTASGVLLDLSLLRCALVVGLSSGRADKQGTRCESGAAPPL